MSKSIDSVPAGTFYGQVPFPEEWPLWLHGAAVTSFAETVEYNGQTYVYAVARRDYHPKALELPGFVSVHGEYVLVSEDVRADYRPFYALHEIVETFTLANQPRRCLQALKIELARVPEEMYVDYILARTDFFRRLIKFHEQNPGISEEALDEMRASHAHLISLGG